MNNDNEKYLKKILKLEDENLNLQVLMSEAKSELMFTLTHDDPILEKRFKKINRILSGKVSNKFKELRFRNTDDEFLEVRKKILKFENEDLIITDPCYVMNDNNKDDWHKCECGFNMEVLGFDPDSYVTSGTIYGDWSCMVYDTDTEEEIGEFCADAGLVSVFKLKDVLKYNPDFDWHINKTWTTAWIKNFTGEVRINYDIDERGDLFCFVEGEGSVNFISSQTGF